MSASRLNFVLLEISNQLNNDNLEKLKFLVRDLLGKNKLEKIKTGHELFNALSERGKLGDDNTDFLSQLLRQAGRDDLSEKLTNLEVQTGDLSEGLSPNEKGKVTAHLRRSFTFCPDHRTAEGAVKLQLLE